MADSLIDVISGALTEIGQLGQGQTANPEDGALGLRQVNLMLSQASTKRLMISKVEIREYTLLLGTNDYTIGPSGTLAGVRPVLVESGQVRVGASSVWIPLTVADKPKWDAIINKGATDEIIGTIYPEYSYPNVRLRVHPTPGSGMSLRLGQWEELVGFINITDPILMPPAYQEWLEAVLAVRLAPFYDQPVPAGVQQRALDATAAVMQINAQSLGGALSPAQAMSSPNVGNPIPQGTPGAPQ